MITTGSQYNRAYQARRQSGSVFKPFVYGAALERGFRPDSLISDSPVVFSKQEAEEKKPRARKRGSQPVKKRLETGKYHGSFFRGYPL